MNIAGPLFKVFYDKIYDYLNINEKQENEENIPSEDEMIDINNMIKTELYEKETPDSIRLNPSLSFFEQYKAFFDEPTFIIDNIYLGSAFNAASLKILKNYKISYIINATQEISNYFPNDFVYRKYNLYDNNKNSIKKYLDKSFNDILSFNTENKGKILIHCYMGASRSASIVLYYLMKSKNWNFDFAFDFLKKKRIIVNPTFRFTKDLTSSFIINKVA